MQLPATRADAIAEFNASLAELKANRTNFIPAITLERLILVARAFHADYCAGLTLGSSGRSSCSYLSNDLGFAFIRCMKVAAVVAPACFLDPRLGAIKAIADVAFSVPMEVFMHVVAATLFCELAECILKRQDAELKLRLLEDVRAAGLANFLHYLGGMSDQAIRGGSDRADHFGRIPLYNLLCADVRASLLHL